MARIRKYKVGQFVCSTYAKSEMLMYVISDVDVVECWYDKGLNKYYYNVRFVNDSGVVCVTQYEWWELRPATDKEIFAHKRLEWIH